MPFSKIAQKVTKYFGYFCLKIWSPELSKVAQSGRTGEGSQQLFPFFILCFFCLAFCHIVLYFWLPNVFIQDSIGKASVMKSGYNILQSQRYEKPTTKMTKGTPNWVRKKIKMCLERFSCIFTSLTLQLVCL